MLCPAPLLSSRACRCAYADRTVIVWEIEGTQGEDYGKPKRALRGHSHFVQDVVLSSDGQFALSGCVPRT